MIPEKWPHAEVEPNGDFQFSHYGIGDGVPPGDYVFVFAILTDRKKKGLVGPDQLKNLYNDPEKNEKKEGFKIEHKSPGKTDYTFDLAVAGQEEATPGPKSVTHAPRLAKRTIATNNRGACGRIRHTPRSRARESWSRRIPANSA